MVTEDFLLYYVDYGYYINPFKSYSLASLKSFNCFDVDATVSIGCRSVPCMKMDPTSYQTKVGIIILYFYMKE